MASQLQEKYRSEVVPKLQKEFDIKSVMAVPRVHKVVLNMGVGEAIQNVKILDAAADELAAIAAQKPTIRRARRSIATFKLREGMPIGTAVTLRRDRMYDFLYRLIHIALPRVRDFRGISPRGFDGRGNYTLGIRDHLIFPEVDYDKVDKSKGLNVTIVTNSGSDEQSRFLLKELGMPFAAR